MTDELAEAKRHIRALIDLDDDQRYAEEPSDAYLDAMAFLDRLDREGQTVEGGEDWEAKFKAHTEAVQGFLAEMIAVYDPCASGEMPVREVCAFLVKQATDDRQRFYDQEAELTRLKAAQVEGGGLYGLMRRTEALWKAKFPEAGLNDHLRKLSGEVRELVDAPDDPDEWADVLLCYLMAAGAKGFSALDLIEMAALKMSVCEAQEFVPVGDGTYRRIKTDIRSLIDQTGGEGGNG